MGCSWPCCALTCVLLSGFGVVFLLVFGALMSSRSNTIEIEHDKMENGSTAAYICAAVYGVFFVISAVYLFIHSRRRTQSAAPVAVPLQSMAEAGDGETPKPDLEDSPPMFSAQAPQKTFSLGRSTSGSPVAD
ncbi:hypothetical protein BESB_015730 [Besnoitia besnoiti]|uniref:Transmembrane protein n=1 Tax=Besnoitia besnoiti TaxID=94643 RepID=A0A2A9M2R0_BESBE|nr:hypothetical protein BESB_015730 [Besnoitia besnoiti]PFH32255.1 hypothetical protein BESB_015730 [Besnoitia besnoiti]